VKIKYTHYRISHPCFFFYLATVCNIDVTFQWKCTNYGEPIVILIAAAQQRVSLGAKTQPRGINFALPDLNHLLHNYQNWATTVLVWSLPVLCCLFYLDISVLSVQSPFLPITDDLSCPGPLTLINAATLSCFHLVYFVFFYTR
jgi:hypothetical protein